MSKSKLADIAQENEELANDPISDIPKSYLQQFGYKSSSLQKLERPVEKSNVVLMNKTTLEAGFIAKQEGYKNVVLLNFANRKHPGGGYTRGAVAQEEDLCRCCPFLYQSLVRSDAYKFEGPQVICTKSTPCLRKTRTFEFLPEDQVEEFYFVSAAAPNRRGGEKFEEDKFRHTFDNILLAPVKRFKFKNPQETCIVLGAWGCGAFGNDPESVAEIMREEIIRFHGHYGKIIFAIPVFKNKRNYEVFKTELRCI